MNQEQKQSEGGDHQLQRGINWLEAQLVRYWPELHDLLALDSVTLLKLLERYGGPGAVAREQEQAAQFMHKASRGTLKQEKIEAVVASAAVPTN